MDTVLIVLYVILGVLCFLVIAGIFVAVPIIMNKFVCGTRLERDPDFKYYGPSEFGLMTEEIKIDYKGYNLYGALYSIKPISQCSKLIIFAHGYGPGHCAYMTEIAYYANRGYAVLAYDNLGCDRSQGKNIQSFSAGTEAVVAAYISAIKDERLKNKPKYLVGHSWGAYSVLCATDVVKVDGVVAFSAFTKPTKVMHSFINNKIISTIIQPSLWVLNRIVGGKNGNADSAKIIKESKVPALLIWGEKDAFVTEKISTAKQADGGNIRKYILSEKRHNPYNTVSAEDKLAELLEGMNKEFADENARKAYFSQFNFVAATEEDPYVMQATVDFIEKR